MAARILSVSSLTRVPDTGSDETIEFSEGVNVIVGAPNTGKTKWLTTLDYLMGDASRAEDALGPDIAAKYVAARAILKIDSVDVEIERRWREPGSRTKVFIDGEGMPVSQFSAWLLDKLQIPPVNFPQGNPYSERAWPELSWRMMLRHVYRQETYWGDLADRQPQSEQHAVVLQFLGLAERVFPPEYGALVALRKEQNRLEARRDQFDEILGEITDQIGSRDTAGMTATPESIQDAIGTIDARVESLREERAKRVDEVIRGVPSEEPDRIAHLSDAWALASTQITNSEQLLRTAEQRLEDLRSYSDAVEEELQRLARARCW